MQRHVVRRTESHLDGAERCRLFRRGWQPPEADRALVWVHGLGEHSGRYDGMGAWLATHGCAVYAYDQRGHGRSQGARGALGAFSGLVRDLDAVVDTVRGEHEGLPLFLGGQGAGAVVVSARLLAGPLEAEGAILSGAAFETLDRESRLTRRLAPIVQRVYPRASRAWRWEPERRTRDLKAAQALLEDPLILRRVSLAWLSELRRSAVEVLLRAMEISTPVLLLHGDMDTLCAARGARRFSTQLRVPGCRLRVYPKLRHELFQEPEQEQVLEDVLAWMRPGGAAAAP